MSTLPGLASKGEKSKQKFQSLDINSLYRVSRGENLEKQQQKTSFTYKHGMQSLGKVPNARRAPANLPSLKSEHSGTDASVPLVPPGGPGWGKQEATSSTTTTSSTITTTSNQQQQQPSGQLSSHQAAIAIPVTTTIPPPQPASAATAAAPPPASGAATAKHVAATPPTATADKSWSAVMSGPDSTTASSHPPLYQSPQFQHEFPSLSMGDGGAAGGGGNSAATRAGGGADAVAPYAAGLSLRPQTEGSWIQGGGARSDGGLPPRSSSVPLGAPPQLAAQVGLQSQQVLPPQFRAVMPTFMYKGSFATGGSGAPTQTTAPPMNGRNRSDNRAPPPRLVDPEEITPRPIIKEEELSRMDEIDKDMGWTCQDDIDYNQKLAFSDDESTEKTTTKKDPKPLASTTKEPENHESQGRNWGPVQRQRSSDEELWKQRRQHNKDLELTVQRAKQRKEEEEKRFNEATKQGAAKKLMELEEKMNKRNREEEGLGTISPSIVPQKPIVPSEIPLPDFHKDKERGVIESSRSRTPEDKSTNFRQLSQIEGKNFATSTTTAAAASTPPRKHVKANETRENGTSFSRHFQSQLPPRFQKQRNNSSGSNVVASMHFQNWSGQKRHDSPDRSGEFDSRDYNRRQNSDDYDFGRKSEEKWKESGEKRDDWHGDRRGEKGHERPQRPDSRDSRASRDSRQSRDSEPREHIGSWAETVFEPTYEEKRIKEDRRQVPGPITKERMEADEMRNEKRGLTQLKRGQIPDKKFEKKDDKLESEEKAEEKESKAWADALPATLMDIAEAKPDEKKSDKSDSELKDDKRNRNRNYASNKGSWSSNEYHRSGGNWPKRQAGGGRNNNNRLHKGEFHGTDSEGSMDDFNAIDGKKSPKKIDKDDKNKEKNSTTLDQRKDKQDGGKRENYVPRGEPSRHGRGGGNFRSRGGLSKRIDGYGPPPAKSPFSHHDDKEKKLSSDENATDDKAKNPDVPLVGVIGSARRETSKMDDKPKRKDNNRRGKSKSKDGSGKRDEDNVDSNSDNSDEKSGRKMNKQPSARAGSLSHQGRRNNPPLRQIGNDKKPSSYRSDGPSIPRQNSSGALRSLKKDDKADISHAIADIITLKNKPETTDGIDDVVDEKVSAADSDGFQEVKSKKTVKERSKEEKQPNKMMQLMKEKDVKAKAGGKQAVASQLMTQQQISNIPPLMATPINPPPVLPQTGKNQFERPRQSKLAPRFAKQRENNRLQKAQMQQQSICGGDVVNDMNKVNQNMNVYGGMKDGGGSSVVPLANSSWDKTLRSSMDGESVLGDGKGLDVTAVAVATGDVVTQSNSPNSEKMMKGNQALQEKAILDGTTPPVNTIIFENTNFKSAPGARNSRDKPRSKLEEGMEGSVFNKPIISDLLGKSDKQSDSIQIPLSFKEDNANDIKLDFFETELTHLTEEKSSKNLCSMPARSMPAANNNAISTADALNFKIQSVKKMWETPNDHAVVGGQDDGNSATSFSTSFVSDPNTLDPNAFVKGNDNAPDDNHEVYSPSPNQVAANNTTNVCKVKPTQQVSGGGGGQAVNHQQHSGIMGPSLMSNPLSPPPLQPVIGTGVNLGQPPQQQYTASQHISYQAGLGGSNQYGISAIPSPPTVMQYNSTQQIQQTAGLYGPFQIDQLAGQGRSQYSQYPNHYSLGQTGSSPYSTQSVYLQTQPHPPPPQAAQGPPDLYQNLSNYRLGTTGPFGQNQQLNNPTTVLISSTSNSLMSASVKPSSQQISAIGTKAGGVGQAYQQQSQQSQQVYMAYEPALQANYLPNAAGVMQRGPTGPVQNNVVPGLQPSSSYYSGSTGQTGYFQQPGSSTIQSAQLQQHQAGYGLQGNVFGTHSQSHTNAAGLQSFNSHFLSTPMLAAAISAQQQQQYRSAAGLPPTQYMKGNNQPPIGGGDQRSQQLKSPGSHQEVLSSVFNSGKFISGSQISSPKLRQNCKQPPPQPSPTAQHKYNLYQGVGNQQTGNMQRYPPPIQRPVNFQQNLGSVQNNSKHRANSNKGPPRQYYQSNSISAQEKIEDNKLNDNSNSTSVNSTSVANKSVGGSAPAAAEIAKDSINIEEAATLKD